MTKKFIAILCIAGVLTGCAVGGEKSTEKTQKAENTQETTTQETEQKTEESEKTTDTSEETAETEEETVPANFKELFQIEADGIDYLSIEDITVPEGTAIAMIGKDSGSSFWKRVRAGAEQAVTDLNEKLGYTGSAKIKVTYDAPSRRM